MSAIATFTLLSISSIDDLRDAAVPKIFKGKPQDHYLDFLAANGRKVTSYRWSGYVLATLFAYLLEDDINLDESELSDLGSFILAVRGYSAVVFANQHRERYLDELDPARFSESELGEYFEEFNETKFEDAGKAMLDGIAAIRSSLSEITPQTFVLLEIR